jgi:hypothetical protein
VIRWLNAHKIRLWVPVAVIKNDDVGAGEIDTQSASTGGQHENELLAVRLIVLVDGVDTVLVRGATVDTAVLYEESQQKDQRNDWVPLTIGTEMTIVLQDVKHTAHLAEDEYP